MAGPAPAGSLRLLRDPGLGFAGNGGDLDVCGTVGL